MYHVQLECHECAHSEHGGSWDCSEARGENIAGKQPSWFLHWCHAGRAVCALLTVWVWRE